MRRAAGECCPGRHRHVHPAVRTRGQSQRPSHILALDGVYTFERERPRFHRAPPPETGELERLLDTLIWRIARTPVRSGTLVAQQYDDGEQVWLALIRRRPGVVFERRYPWRLEPGPGGEHLATHDRAGVAVPDQALAAAAALAAERPEPLRVPCADGDELTRGIALLAAMGLCRPRG